MFRDLEGREFDWFAVDSNGNIGMFSTAGEGFIPEAVGPHIAEHDGLSADLPAPNTGSAQVWSDYAALGLYVFDWSLPGGPYILRGIPASPMAGELRQRVFGIRNLPAYPGYFSNLSKLSAWAFT